MSALVRLEKDSKQPEWEADCVTYRLDGNTLNILDTNVLWKMISQKMVEILSKTGAHRILKMGSWLRDTFHGRNILSWLVHNDLRRITSEEEA
jgi:hypothetical protein